MYELDVEDEEGKGVESLEWDLLQISLTTAHLPFPYYRFLGSRKSCMIGSKASKKVPQYRIIKNEICQKEEICIARLTLVFKPLRITGAVFV